MPLICCGGSPSAEYVFFVANPIYCSESWRRPLARSAMRHFSEMPRPSGLEKLRAFVAILIPKRHDSDREHGCRCSEVAARTEGTDQRPGLRVHRVRNRSQRPGGRPALALQSWIEERRQEWKGLRGLLFKQRPDYAERDGRHAGISATIRTKGKRGLCSLSDRSPSC
jgi:hypothetical protein